jgi:exodeoxyribonuclease V alpha subunit
MIPPMKPSPTDDASLMLAKHAARTLVGLATSGHDAVEAAARAVVLAERSGHACVPLEELKTSGIDVSQLRTSGVVTVSNPASGIRHPASLPLVLDLDRLYLHRLHDHETRLAARLRRWLEQPDFVVDEALLTDVFTAAGMNAVPGETDWQERAVEAACRRPFAIISGGPGTGKTRTAAVLLHALARLDLGLRIALAAPTGKAAARLQTSIEQTRMELAKNEVPKTPNAELPTPNAEASENASVESEANPLSPAGGEGQDVGAAPSDTPAAPPPVSTTLHRLLGASTDGRRFRHGPGNPLPHDLVLVDEASMVDLAMMCRLVTALKPSARLVLLGDKDQLASVDAGYVLGDICDAVGLNPSGPATPTAVELQRNFRFGADSAIGRLATLVRQGDSAAVLAALQGLDLRSEVVWQTPISDRELGPLLGDLFDQKLRACFQAKSAEEAVHIAARFQILCAVRRGAFGVDGINQSLEARLEQLGLRRAGQTWYAGRPVLVTANDPQQGLFNGDLGLAWPDNKGQLRICFSTADGLRAFSPAQLPPHTTAFAITVHKSQGSEFDEALVVLPPGESPVCTRELLYTGLTRAKQKAVLWASEAALSEAVARRVRRASGLAERLRR